MSNFVIPDIKPFGSFEPDKSYLVLIAIDKTPPHLAFISNLNYYSLSSNGVKIGVNASIILNSLNRKQIPSLFLPLSQKLNNDIVHSEYIKYSQLDKGQSCLTPIKQILGSLSDSLLKAQFAFDLIPLLFHLNIVNNSYSVNYDQAKLELISYGQKEIDLAIYNAAQLC